MYSIAYSQKIQQRISFCGLAIERRAAKFNYDETTLSVNSETQHQCHRTFLNTKLKRPVYEASYNMYVHHRGGKCMLLRMA